MIIAVGTFAAVTTMFYSLHRRIELIQVAGSDRGEIARNSSIVMQSWKEPRAVHIASLEMIRLRCKGHGSEPSRIACSGLLQILYVSENQSC